VHLSDAVTSGFYELRCERSWVGQVGRGLEKNRWCNRLGSMHIWAFLMDNLNLKGVSSYY
jgi:hypothetical protein